MKAWPVDADARIEKATFESLLQFVVRGAPVLRYSDDEPGESITDAGTPAS
jgi:hypothetical protein